MMRDKVKRFGAALKEDKKILLLILYIFRFEKEPARPWHKPVAAGIFFFLSFVGSLGLYYTYQSYQLTVKLSYYNFLSETNSNKYALKKALEELPKMEAMDSLTIGAQKDFELKDLTLTGTMTDSEFYGTTLVNAELDDLLFDFSVTSGEWRIKAVNNTVGELRLINNDLYISKIQNSKLKIAASEDLIKIAQCNNSTIDTLRIDNQLKNEKISFYESTRNKKQMQELPADDNKVEVEHSSLVLPYQWKAKKIDDINAGIFSKFYTYDPYKIGLKTRKQHRITIDDSNHCNINFEAGFHYANIESASNSTLKLNWADRGEDFHTLEPPSLWIKNSKNIVIEGSALGTTDRLIVENSTIVIKRGLSKLITMVPSNREPELMNNSRIDFDTNEIRKIHLHMKDLSRVNFGSAPIKSLFLVLTDNVNCEALRKLPGSENITFNPKHQCNFGQTMNLATYTKYFRENASAITNYMQNNKIKYGEPL